MVTLDQTKIGHSHCGNTRQTGVTGEGFLQAGLSVSLRGEVKCRTQVSLYIRQLLVAGISVAEAHCSYHSLPFRSEKSDRHHYTITQKWGRPVFSVDSLQAERVQMISRSRERNNGEKVRTEEKSVSPRLPLCIPMIDSVEGNNQRDPRNSCQKTKTV